MKKINLVILILNLVIVEKNDEIENLEVEKSSFRYKGNRNFFSYNVFVKNSTYKRW